ncbi:MAG: hypothetical protein ACI9T7_002539 [Oleiphilaceae bacterium]
MQNRQGHHKHEQCSYLWCKTKKKIVHLTYRFIIKLRIGHPMSLSIFSTTSLVSLITLSLITSNIEAAKPMTEDDLGGVSAETGDNILNIFGAPAAGLTIDQDYTSTSPSEQQDTYQEGDTTEVFALEEIKSLENSSINQTIEPLVQDVDISVFEEAIYASKQTVGTANLLDFSSSEIRYFDKDVHHKLTIISNNNIETTRDLYIDLLTVKELNTTEGGPSAGSIFLSDWRSQGKTSIISR